MNRAGPTVFPRSMTVGLAATPAHHRRGRADCGAACIVASHAASGQFPGATDNLLQNALAKRRLQGEFAISVSLSCGDTARLEVRDGGRAVADETARELLHGTVPSEGGLGIGLYQVARHAEACGYSLELTHNADGEVSFMLSGSLKPAAGLPAA